MNQSVNGILNILKPPGMTSFDVVAYLRRLLKIPKIGHTGTLDPDAAGVLPVCVGNATKVIEYLIEKDKQYRAEITLGISTDTQDSGGEVRRAKETAISRNELEEAVKAFIGPILQTPPMYSSIRIKGVRLHELARKGVTVDREPRPVTINNINVLKLEQAFFEYNGRRIACTRALIDVSCSKGTYIRTLCADIGDRLGCGGHMSFLVRTRTGCFTIDDSVTLEEVADAAEKRMEARMLLPVDIAFTDMAKITLGDDDVRKFQNGMTISLKSGYENGSVLRVYNPSGTFIAFGLITADGHNCRLKSKKLILGV